MRSACFVVLLATCATSHAYDANGVALGATEAAVRKVFSSAHCKELEWKSDAADRRCDASRIRYAGVSARITLYLNKDVLRGFDVRFNSDELKRVIDFLKSRHGAPAEDVHETLPQREIHRLRWTRGADHIELIARTDNRRAQVFVSRGEFAQEIYRVR